MMATLEDTSDVDVVPGAEISGRHVALHSRRLGELRETCDDISGIRLPPAPASSVIAPGTIIDGRYLIERPLGAGGHGAVHRARHLALDLPVAVKVLALEASGARDELAARFAREARTVARIQHRNVLTVHDTGALPDGSPYLVTELIEGEDLEQRIAASPLSVAAVIDLGRQLFGALTATADAGVLHRDIKPANVMLRRQSDERVHVTLIDFGIARGPEDGPRLTVTGQILGTPHYMAPEQLRGENLDERVDIYAACAVLYEALTGVPPFDGPAAPVVIGRILGSLLEPIRSLRPDCPAELAQLIEGGLAKKPADRPSHPLDVVTSLEAIASTLGVPTGAAAWAGELEHHATPPLALSRLRYRTPPEGAPSPPVDDPPSPNDMPADPSEPSKPVDPTPERRARVIRAASVVFGLAAAASIAFSFVSPSEDGTIVADAPAAAQAQPAPIVDAPPTDASAQLGRGLEALARGEIDLALSSYRAACEIEPARAEAQRGRGLAAMRAGLTDEAILSFESYLALSPDAPDAERIHSRLRTLRARR